MDPLAALLRRYVDDWLNAADASVCEELLDPDYAVHIGGHLLAGRDDAYVPATLRQLQQFPGLVVTVHEVLVARDRIAMRFSERGASVRHGGRTASWTGVALFRWDGTRLTEAFVEEDYWARRAQLAGAAAVPPALPAAASWAHAPAAPDPAAENLVRRWLRAPGSVSADAVVADDGSHAARAPLVDVVHVEVQEIFSRRGLVAFAATQRGTYLGGLDAAGPGGATGGAEVDVAVGVEVELGSAGIVEVADGRITSGHVVRDRLGLERRLQPR